MGKREYTSSDVVPIRIIWGKLLQLTGLHNVCPWGKLDLKQMIDITLINVKKRVAWAQITVPNKRHYIKHSKHTSHNVRKKQK